MTWRQHLGIVIALACLAACARPPPPEPRHRCVEIPNGLVACHEITPQPPASR